MVIYTMHHLTPLVPLEKETWKKRGSRIRFLLYTPNIKGKETELTISYFIEIM